MKFTKGLLLVLVLLALLIVGWYVLVDRVDTSIEEVQELYEQEPLPAVSTTHLSDGGQPMEVTFPLSDGEVSSPMAVTGSVAGSWYFEATFPVILTNWDGLIIAEGYATALDDWMTTDMVPFEAVIDFESPYSASDPDFMQYGFLILQKSNASGLPEHDDAVELRVMFIQ